MRASRVHWLLLAGCLLSALHGCGKSSPRATESSGEAGRDAPGGEGASAAHAGEDDARGGATAGGTGGSSGRGAAGAGTSGISGSAGSGNLGGTGYPGVGGGGAAGDGSGDDGLGGEVARGGTAPTSGASGSGGAAGGPVVVPANWLCEGGRYADGVCDCGCGIVDIDCPSASADECEACSYVGCADEACSVLFPDDNSVCTAVPHAWSCSERLYNDGSQCDCGCGFRDPDCPENLLAECDRCNAVGSCSGQACPGTINPSSAERCERPPVPEGWTCSEDRYAEGFQCDCGCGVPDPDCRTNTAESCVQCHCGGGMCPDAVDPADPTRCAPPPEDWLCSPETWSDTTCDCGCGVPDTACGYYTPLYCIHCLGCAEGDCERIHPDDNSRCRP